MANGNGERRRNGAGPVRGVGLIITNAIKVAGLGIGLKEGFTSQDVATMCFAAFMMAGAQVSESVLLTLIERFLGVQKDRT